MSSLKFVVSSLEIISTAKNKQLASSAQAALSAIRESAPQLPDPEIVFAPLQLATQVGNVPLATVALDCIGKLISYSYFATSTSQPRRRSHAEPDEDGGGVQQSEGASPHPTPSVTPASATPAPEDPATDRARKFPLIERAIDTICDCFQGETTAAEIQVQIVKSLLAAVLDDKIVVHGAGLLKAVRQVYNVFLLSRSTANQQVAQGTLTQMAGRVFERVKTRLNMKEARSNLSRLQLNSSNITFENTESLSGTAESTNGGTEVDDSSVQGGEATPTEAETKLTLKDLENRKSFDDSNLGEGPTMVTQLKPTTGGGSRSTPEQAVSLEDADALDAEDEVYVRDAYLVFRSFCNLAAKVLAPDQLYDIRSQAMRSKLVSLHLIQTLLNNNLHVFSSPLCTIKNSRSNEPTNFLQAIKFYLCLSITRNGASSVDKIFEVTCEIFWLMLKFLRASFKKEIEVFLNEIYLALLQKKTAPTTQKAYFVGILHRLCADPRALVEVYLNYDCDRNVGNIFQQMIEEVSRFATLPIAVSAIQEQYTEERSAKGASQGEWQMRTILPPSLSVAQMSSGQDGDPDVPREYQLKRSALDALVESLRAMVNWSAVPGPESEMVKSEKPDNDSKLSVELRASIDPSIQESIIPRLETPSQPTSPNYDDNLRDLEREKARKTVLDTAIKHFNFKPKKGIRLLLKEGIIPTDSPQDIAHFLLNEPRLDKAMIGAYMGEGTPENIAIMHAFVDSMDFAKKRFVDALRQFLQAFRLPGEAQVVDRYMLKFANRYHDHNPNAFANADTAYVLAYSVILLNTDLHSSKVVRRMSKEDFVKNNRGVNDNADLPPEYLHSIYDEIASNEIVLKSERDAVAAAGVSPQPTGLAAGIGQALSNVGRDLQREAYIQQSEEISLRSEQLFKSLFKSQRRNATRAGGNRYIAASASQHIGPMFDVTWMSYFSALSSQIQKTNNLEVNKLCLEGMRLATKIACLFGLSTPREAFVSALRNTTNLNSPREILAKNVEAIKALLELGQTEGNVLMESWKDILMCISQLDRLQLIFGGVDENAVPDVSKARFMPPPRVETADSLRSSQSRGRPRTRSSASQGFSNVIALESRSDELVKAVDRIFTNTANLTGEAIVHFARALTEVSWDEIKVSGSNESPRTYSLQKIVEISYYNMTRVRFEWSNIWDVLGKHFNRVGCHNNTAIVFFALDSLRQLSMRFLEIEELPGFKFQKDFLKPFEHVLSNAHNVTVKDMVLRCLMQMIQARGDNIRSGWRTMFGVFTVAARESHESIVSLAYENVSHVYKTQFGVVVSQGAFTDLIVCLTEFSKNLRFQKKSLQALETLKSIIPRMLRSPECPVSLRQSSATAPNATPAPAPAHAPAPASADSGEAFSRQQHRSRTSAEEGFWFPILFAFHDILMTGEDLEVRSNALDYFFDALLKYGADFSSDFWDILWRQQLYPIFMVLRSQPEMSNVLSHEELSVWLSTTMIQALRNMITLFTHYFGALEYMLDRFLDLLALCICQENDTISRIGSNCLQQLILRNVTKFQPAHWSKIVVAFCELFERTTAYQLFSAATINSTASLPPPPNGLEYNGPLSPAPGNMMSMDETSLKINGTESNGSPLPMIAKVDPDTPKTADDDDDGVNDDNARNPSMTAAAAAATTQQPPTPLEDYRPASSLQQQPVVVSAARKRFFNRIIYRCVLQLLMIETVNELFSNDSVYAQIPATELLRLMALLKKSFLFARRFNNDLELRMKLWREGFMNQLPNLLKQESGSSATYVSILFRMFADGSPERAASRPDVEAALVPLCMDIVAGYVGLDEESQHRNVLAWRPVVVDVLDGYASFPEKEFRAHVKDFYPVVVELLGKELNVDLRNALLVVLRRVGEVALGVKEMGKTKKKEEPVERRDSLPSRAASTDNATTDKEGEMDAGDRMAR